MYCFVPVCNNLYQFYMNIFDVSRNDFMFIMLKKVLFIDDLSIIKDNNVN